jgi:integrase
VDQIDTPDILRVLSPIWLTKPERLGAYANGLGPSSTGLRQPGHRTGDNPVEGVSKGLPKQNGRDEHHAALPYAEVPAFVARLRSSDNGEIARLAFEFLILTAARTSEVLGATWDEYDEAERLWTVPAERMKAGRLHRVPLSSRCVQILERAKLIGGGSRFIFPGRSGTKALSNMVFLMALRRMKLDITAHGFRSSFRDWAAETTSYPRELAESALAHTIENKVEAAYRRGTC